jgi:4-hydroxybenzoate polyprenyltransferase
MGRLRRLLVRSRPRFWMYLAGPVLVGVAYGAGSVADLFSVQSWLLFGYFLLPANVYLYGVNDLFDADVDVENPKKRGREIRWSGDPVVLATVFFSGAGVLVLVPLVNQLAWLWLGGFMVLATAYSMPPLRLKTRPPLDSVSNGLYVLPGAAAYTALAGADPPLLAVVGGWLWTMGMHTFSAVPDIEPDRAAGIETTATILGERPTLLYCAACWLLAAALFAVLDLRAGALLLLYPLLVAGIDYADVDVDRAYWWYPFVNTAVGMVLTLGGLWGLVNG